MLELCGWSVQPCAGNVRTPPLRFGERVCVLRVRGARCAMADGDARAARRDTRGHGDDRRDVDERLRDRQSSPVRGPGLRFRAAWFRTQQGFRGLFRFLRLSEDDLQNSMTISLNIYSCMYDAGCSMRTMKRTEVIL